MINKKQIGISDHAKRVAAVKEKAIAEGLTVLAPVAKATYSVEETATRYGVSCATVLVWIRKGELQAVNVSRSRHSKKPRFRITAAALDAFEAARTPTPPAPQVRRRKRTADVIEFICER